MHLAKLMTMLAACILLCSLSAFSQPPLPIEADRPTQRWLPLPQGDGTDLSAQAQLLQQLRDMISGDSGEQAGDSPLPKLSEQQLREMEKALESMRELIGEDKLPNLENIPKEWIDQALSDPVLRKQAQQLLEQYARDRNLPPPTDRTPRNSDGVPFPRRQPSDRSNARSAENRPASPQATPDASSNLSPKPKPPRESTPGQQSTGSALNNQAPNNPALNNPVPRDQSRNRSATGNLESSNPGRSGQTPSSEISGEGIKEQSLAPNRPRGEKSSSESESGQALVRPMPASPDAERIEALQELFKKLKAIEGQRGLEKNASEINSGNGNSSSPSQSKSKSSNSSRATNPNMANSQSNPAAPRSSRNSPKPSSSLPDERLNQPSQATAENPTGGSAGNNSLGDAPLLPPESSGSTSANSTRSQSNSPKSNPLESPRSPSGNDPKRSLPGSQSADSSVKRNAQNSSDRTSSTGVVDPRDRNQSPTGSNKSLMPEADIKTQLERHGLGRALQSIVEKTMKEQGEANSARNQTTNKRANTPAKDDKTANKAVPPSAPAPDKATPNKPTTQNPQQLAKGNAADPKPSVTPSSNQNLTNSTMSGLRDLAAQFWGAIRTAPNEIGGGSTATAPSVSTTLPKFSGLGSAGSGQVWLLLGLILVLITMFFLLARKRIVLAAAAKEADAELAKVILTEGIRTRADVVRAFHRFVLRRAQPVANWWTHRYAALRLTEATPQLRSVITDLASVYEHARYLPPDVTLSSEDIERVQSALKQCAAHSG